LGRRVEVKRGTSGERALWLSQLGKEERGSKKGGGGGKAGVVRRNRA